MSAKHTPYHDRGNSLRQQSRNHSNSSVKCTTARPARDRELSHALWEALVCSSNDDSKCFIPFNTLQLAKDRKLVEQTLRHKDSGVSAGDIPKLLETICSGEQAPSAKSFFRIFAILVICKNTRYISEFIELGVDDAYLPLPTIRRSEGKITILHKNEKYRPRIKSEKVERIFQDQEDWDSDKLHNFNTRQWWAIAPFLWRRDNVIPHYVLEASDVLPFTGNERSKGPQIEVDDQDGPETVDPEPLLEKEGGFSDVFRVQIHPSHYDFGTQPYSDGSHTYILKRLKSPNENEFKQEVNALIKYDHGIGKHLLPLLATIEKEETNSNSKYYLLFPEAKGDLRDFWKTQFTRNANSSLLRWMAEQCLGVTRALSMLHQDQDQDKQEDYPIYGRHGDIKAANILWFSKPGSTDHSGWVLVLSDYGLVRFHRFMSRSIQTARNIKKTITYQAPEFDIGKISRKSDVWALGCTFLEFITCYLKGFHAVNEDFPSQRGEYDERLKFDADKFYRTIQDGKWAELKPSVRNWISDLHQSPKCCQYLHEFLHFIENNMLRIERDERPAASEVVETLESLLKRCQNENYLSGQSGQCSVWQHGRL
ncbi:kinase-like protein [Annulohypoxylon truncatum]|uniref:kinase-like protein n=1 Tax=Annulohypoxylon truncatum TaxID=327061 RepID=UPI002007F0AA|nr:kinase-like protein [Annulohypoxylon truncatum]KAI1208245.1 kinase-like protein [Annulohypoxylon truncatum]